MAGNTPIYGNQGGTELTIGVGGSLIIEDGATLTIEAGTAVADLDQDVTGTYVEAEVQAISDKVDELLAVLRTAGIIAAS